MTATLSTLQLSETVSGAGLLREIIARQIVCLLTLFTFFFYHHVWLFFVSILWQNGVYIAGSLVFFFGYCSFSHPHKQSKTSKAIEHSEHHFWLLQSPLWDQFLLNSHPGYYHSCGINPIKAAAHNSCTACNNHRCKSCRNAEVPEINDSTTCSVVSQYPAVPVLEYSGRSLPSTHLNAFPSITEYSSFKMCRIIVRQPQQQAVLSITAPGGIKPYNATYMYICCQCGDGPKVFNHQPRCIRCNHDACSKCKEVKYWVFFFLLRGLVRNLACSLFSFANWDAKTDSCFQIAYFWSSSPQRRA